MKLQSLFFALALLTSQTVFAQNKVLEKSEKKQPAWAKNLAEAGYIITSGDATTLQEAQQTSLLLVKEEIARSVAEQIISVSTRSVQEKNYEVSETFAQNITTKVGKIPYLQGISATQIDEIYWEQLQEKATKRIFFRYYIKYPFSKAQLTKLVSEFRAEDEKITQRIAQLETELGQQEDAEQIDAAIDELAALVTTLEDGRKDRASNLLARYRRLCDNVVMKQVQNVLGHLEFQLTMGDRPLVTARQPKVKSDCATITQVSIGAVCSVDYNYNGCYRDIENFVEVSYRLGSRTIAHKFLIPLE